jgi:SAM-dependent methyltransferase
MKRRFKAKITDDGEVILNIGCGIKMHWQHSNLDFSPYAFLRHNMFFAKILKLIAFLSNDRYRNLLKVDPQIIRWDLRKGIPFENETFNVVYSSMLLEHIPREIAPYLMKECHRVLKKGGIIRVVVPDLEYIVKFYVKALFALENGKEGAMTQHSEAICELLDQMVRDESTGTSQQRPLVKLVERLIRGNAAKSGELHRWMYDKYSLRNLLESAGFYKISLRDAFSSAIKGWQKYCLDSNEDGGNIYKPGSLLMEGEK